MTPFPMRLVHPAMSARLDNCLEKGEHAYESGCRINDAPYVISGGALNDAYFNPGSYPVQYNVADSNMLKDMRKHPENHSDLMRRAASFTAKLIAPDLTVQQQLSTAPSWIKPAFFPTDGRSDVPQPPSPGGSTASVVLVDRKKPARAHVVCSGRRLRGVFQFSICRPKKEAAVSANARSVSPAVLSTASVINSTQPITSP